MLTSAEYADFLNGLPKTALIDMFNTLNIEPSIVHEEISNISVRFDETKKNYVFNIQSAQGGKNVIQIPAHVINEKYLKDLPLEQAPVQGISQGNAPTPINELQTQNGNLGDSAPLTTFRVGIAQGYDSTKQAQTQQPATQIGRVPLAMPNYSAGATDITFLLELANRIKEIDPNNLKGVFEYFKIPLDATSNFAWLGEDKIGSAVNTYYSRDRADNLDKLHVEFTFVDSKGNSESKRLEFKLEERGELYRFIEFVNMNTVQSNPQPIQQTTHDASHAEPKLPPGLAPYGSTRGLQGTPEPTDLPIFPDVPNDAGQAPSPPLDSPPMDSTQASQNYSVLSEVRAKSTARTEDEKDTSIYANNPITDPEMVEAARSDTRQAVPANQAGTPAIPKSEKDRLDELKAKLKDSFVKEFEQNVRADFGTRNVRQASDNKDMTKAYFDLIKIDDLYNQFFDSIIKTYTAQTILAMEAEILTDDAKYEQLAKSMSRAFKGELPSQTTNGVSHPSLEAISNPAEVIQRASITLATDLIQNSYIKPFKNDKEVSDIAAQICLKGKTKHPTSSVQLVMFTNQYLGPVLLTNKFDDEQKNKYIDTYQNLMAGMVNQMQKKGKPFYDKNIGLTNLALDALSRYAAQAAQNPQLQNLSEKQQISYGKSLLKNISQDREFKKNYSKAFPGGTAENERKVRDNITIYGEKAKSKLARKLINRQKTQQKIRGQATASNAYEDVKPQRPAPYPNASPEKATNENTQNSIDLEKALRALSAEQLKSYLEIAEDINPKSIIVTFNPVKQGYIISSNETEFNRGFKASSIGAAIAKAQAMAANSVHQSLTEAQPSIEVKMRKADRKLNSAQLDKNAENVQKLFNKTPREMLNHLLNDGATTRSAKSFDPSEVKVMYDHNNKKYIVHDDKKFITLNKDQMTQVVKILQTVYDKNPTNNKPEVEAQKPKRPFLNRLLQRLSKDPEKKNSPPSQKPL